MKSNIQLAQANDLPKVKQFLATLNLPVSDLSQGPLKIYHLSYEGELVATVGLEKHGTTGLLRSLGVKETFRNQQLANNMVNYVFEISKKEGISDLYLLTSTAEAYFKRKGFTTISREKVPVEIRQTSEFSTVCPSSAIVMHRPVEMVQVNL